MALAEKGFGIVVFGVIAFLSGVWSWKDLRAGVAYGPLGVHPKATTPYLFWVSVGARVLLAAAGAFGALQIALS